MRTVALNAPPNQARLFAVSGWRPTDSAPGLQERFGDNSGLEKHHQKD